MFVDASAIVAILTREPEADPLADALEKARSPITSPIAIFEAALGICRKRHATAEEAGGDVAELLELGGGRGGWGRGGGEVGGWGGGGRRRGAQGGAYREAPSWAAQGGVAALGSPPSQRS